MKAFGFGIATIASDGAILDTFFHGLGLGTLAEQSTPEMSRFEGSDELRKVQKKVVAVEIDLTQAPKDVPDAYLRLHLLSHRIVKPHGLSLDGIFGILNNVVWTSHGPCSITNFAESEFRLRQKVHALLLFFHQEVRLLNQLSSKRQPQAHNHRREKFPNQNLLRVMSSFRLK